MNHRLIYAILILLFNLGLKAQPDFMQGSLVNKNFSEIVPVKIKNDKMLIEATIQGKKALFLLDTGAPTLLTKSFFESLNLEETGAIDVKDVTNKTLSMPWVKVPEIEIGQLSFKDIPALIIDFSGSPANCSEEKIAGFIGSNQLKDVILQLDWNNQQVLLTDQKSSLNLPKKGIAFNIDSGGQPLLQIKLKGKKTEVMFDTGFNGLYSMPNQVFKENESYFQSMILAEGQGRSGQAGIFGVETNDTRQILLQIPKIKIGQHRVKNVTCSPSSGDDALLGTQLLKNGLVTLDYPAKQIYLTDFKSSPKPYQNFGFEWSINPQQEWIIGTVWNNTEAAKKGLQSNNKVLQINDLKLEGQPFCETEKALDDVLEQANEITLKVLTPQEEVLELQLKKIDWVRKSKKN